MKNRIDSFRPVFTAFAALLFIFGSSFISPVEAGKSYMGNKAVSVNNGDNSKSDGEKYTTQGFNKPSAMAVDLSGINPGAVTGNQGGKYNCAAFSLAALFADKGVSMDDISAALKPYTNEQGYTSLEGLQIVANQLGDKYGLDYEAVKTSFPNLVNDTDAIVHFSYGHYVKLVSYDESSGIVSYKDNGELKTATRDEFESQFSGYALVNKSKADDKDVISNNEAAGVLGAKGCAGTSGMSGGGSSSGSSGSGSGGGGTTGSWGDSRNAGGGMGSYSNNGSGGYSSGGGSSSRLTVNYSGPGTIVVGSTKFTLNNNQNISISINGVKTSFGMNNGKLSVSIGGKQVSFGNNGTLAIGGKEMSVVRFGADERGAITETRYFSDKTVTAFQNAKGVKEQYTSYKDGSWDYYIGNAQKAHGTGLADTYECARDLLVAGHHTTMEMAQVVAAVGTDLTRTSSLGNSDFFSQPSTGKTFELSKSFNNEGDLASCTWYSGTYGDKGAFQREGNSLGTIDMLAGHASALDLGNDGNGEIYLMETGESGFTFFGQKADGNFFNMDSSDTQLKDENNINLIWGAMMGGQETAAIQESAYPVINDIINPNLAADGKSQPVDLKSMESFIKNISSVPGSGFTPILGSSDGATFTGWLHGKDGEQLGRVVYRFEYGQDDNVTGARETVYDMSGKQLWDKIVNGDGKYNVGEAIPSGDTATPVIEAKPYAAASLQEAYSNPDLTLGDISAICEEKWGPVLGKIAVPLAVLGAAEFKAVGIDPGSNQAKDAVKDIYGYTGGMANVPATAIFGLDMADPYNKNVLTPDQRLQVFKDRPMEVVEFGAVAVTAGGGGLIGAGARAIAGESAAAMVETTALGATKAGAAWAGVSAASDEAYSLISGKGLVSSEEMAKSAREGYATGFVFGTALESLGAFANARNAGEFANLVKANPEAYSWWQRQIAVSGEALGMFAKNPDALAMNSLTGAATFIGAGPVFHAGSWVVESGLDSLATGNAHFVEMNGPQGETGLPWYQDLALSSADSPKQGLWLGPATSAFGLSSLTLDGSGKGVASVWSRNAANSGPLTGTVDTLLGKDAPVLTQEANWLTAGLPTSAGSLVNQFDNAIFYSALNTAIQTGLVKAGFSQSDANLISQAPFFLVPRYAGGTPVKDGVQEASGKILDKVISREQAVQLGFDLPVEGTGPAKEAYLPTKELKESDLPGTPGLRQPREISVPKSSGDIPQVKVVFPDNADIRLVSDTHSGKQGAVKLGFLESGSPVVLKTYTEPSDAVIDDGRPQSALIEESLLKDYQGGKIADDLGIGPGMHGIYKDAAGKEWIVMDLVAGEVYSSSFQNKGWINENTVNDFAEVNKRLTENNRGLTGDLQFIVGSSGHIQLIDAAGLTYEVKTDKSRAASDKKFAGIEQELIMSAGSDDLRK